MNKEIKIILTLNEKTTEFDLPVEDDMEIVDFLISLQMFLATFSNLTTFDIYDSSFERIALVGKDNELYISKTYSNLKYIYDLFNSGIDKIEVIALSSSSVEKVLKEEKLLKEALDNYKI